MRQDRSFGLYGILSISNTILLGESIRLDTSRENAVYARLSGYCPGMSSRLKRVFIAQK